MVVTKASLVARSLKLGLPTLVSTWVGDHQGRPGALSLVPIVSVDFNV